MIIRRNDISQKARAGYARAMGLKDQAESEQRPLTESERVRAKAALAEAQHLQAKGRLSVDEILGNNNGPFKNFGEQLMAIARAESQFHQRDSRLDVVNAMGANEQVPSEGGFLVQPNFETDLLLGLWETSNLASRCWRIPITGNSLKMPAIDEPARTAGSRFGGVQSYWIGEGETIPDSKPAFRSLELSLKKLAAIVYATDELLADAQVMAALVKRLAIAELAYTVDAMILNGIGGARPLGILNSGACVEIDPEDGQATGSLVYENLVKMWAALLPYARQDAVWLINPELESQLYGLYLTIGDSGVPVYLPSGGASGSQYTTLFGRPVIPVEQCSAPGTVGDIVLANLNQGYVIAERNSGVQAAESIHVRFLFDESVFRFVYRFDGQPTISAPITPHNGDVGQSYFVTLGARSG